MVRFTVSESNDDFSEEENYVPPSDSDDSDSTEASDEDDSGGGDSTSVDTQGNNALPRAVDWKGYADNVPDFTVSLHCHERRITGKRLQSQL